MAITRRQFAYGVLASMFSSDPLKAASEMLEKATSPGWFSSPDINAAVLDVGYGKERYTKAYGAAGTPERVFIIASISKVIVATGAMVLKDRGRLALQDRVVRFVPEFRGEGRDQVTIQNLLTHTAGLPDNLPQIRQMQARQAGLEEIFAATCNVPLLFKPGTAFSYSNLGVLVLKEIMERIGSVPLGQFCFQIPSGRPLSDCTARRAHLGITAFPARSLGPISSAAFRWCCLRPSSSGIHGTVSWGRCRIWSRNCEDRCQVSNHDLRNMRQGI
jgi:hypothetical protein